MKKELRYFVRKLLLILKNETMFSLRFIPTFFSTQRLSTRDSIKGQKNSRANDVRQRIARRAAMEFKDGMYGRKIYLSVCYLSQIECQLN